MAEDRVLTVRSELDERGDFFRRWAGVDRARITIRDPHGKVHSPLRHDDQIACQAARRTDTIRAIAATRGRR